MPIGIAAAHRPVLYQVLRPLLDLMQTIPTFVYLIPTMVLFGLGVVPGLISTVIFAIARADPAHPISASPRCRRSCARRARRSARPSGSFSSDRAALGAADHHGAHHAMHHAEPVDGGDRDHGRRWRLGTPVERALQNVDISMGFEAGLAIVVLAIILDRVCKRPEHR